MKFREFIDRFFHHAEPPHTSAETLKEGEKCWVTHFNGSRYESRAVEYHDKPLFRKWKSNGMLFSTPTECREKCHSFNQILDLK